MRRLRPLTACVALVSVVAGSAAHAILSDIAHSSEAPDRESAGVVRFSAEKPARVTVRFYDVQERLLRTITEHVAAGARSLTWDGRRETGDPVPDGAYTYTVEATADSGERVLWDLADFAGKRLDVSAQWDPDSGRLRYRMPEAGRVRVRAGLKNDGPLLRTIIDWVARTKGEHIETWDGKGASGHLELGRHPGLEFQVSAFSLPRNTMFVGKPESEVVLLNHPEETPIRQRRKETSHRMMDPARQPASQRRDFEVKLDLPDVLPRTAEGHPIVRGPVPVTVSVTGLALANALNQRSESVFYVDGAFVFERETGFLPVTWTWEPRGHARGLHYLSTNIRGYEDQFGIGTIPIWVETESTDGSR